MTPDIYIPEEDRPAYNLACLADMVTHPEGARQFTIGLGSLDDA